MDTDTYSNGDVARAANRGYINLDVNLWKGRDLATKLDVRGTPMSVVVSPEGDPMGVITGYQGVHDYLEWMASIPRDHAELRKIEKQVLDAVAACRAGELHLRLGRLSRARECFMKALQLFTGLKGPSPDERGACARAAIHLIDAFYSAGDREVKREEILDLAGKAKAADPDNRHGMLDDALAFESYGRYLSADLQGALELARRVEADHPKSNRIDLARYVAGAALMGSGEKDEGRAILNQVISDFPTSLWGRMAKIVLETLDR